jgi:hypothetical protein
MLTLYNALSQLNDFADEATYRLKGNVSSTACAPDEFRSPPCRLAAI